jgi:GntR family transcriptional repressor for pyruvate dehydrogenase complex
VSVVPEGFVEALRTPPTFEAAIEEIIAAIGRERLRRGDRLPNEAQLAAGLGISKPTLRQALRVLQRSGVLDVRAGKGGGIFVASELLPYDAVAGNIALETNAVVEILRGRRIVETAVTHAASREATPEDYVELERIVGLSATHHADREAMLRADAMFHAAIARATHNRLLADTMRLLARQIAPLRDMMTGDGGEGDRIVSIHTRQLRAMRTRETAQLDAVLDEHFRVIEERYAQSHDQAWSALFDSSQGKKPAPFEPSWQKLASLPGAYRAHAWRESRS